ncbi:acetolactate synthase catalytic subunit [Acidisoma sp. S159]|uniref:acetolactate synthase catalytic subunit n=1 Tax=Acidisoma sp. S159 TaxID=1747225 RepID=UPI00131E5DC4|nr:acetolactate synthase catalytic subunit [Acidisoma sp. S159]
MKTWPDVSGGAQPRGNITSAQIFAAALKRHGVEAIFGQSIPAALFLATPQFGIRQIGYRTENAGSYMADAYARVSHKVAVVTAQNGPAATLLVAGLAEALKASVPIVAIVQDVPRSFTDRNAFQEFDHLELFRGCAKWVRRITDSQRIDDYVDMAFAAAATGRCGPAVLIVPIDLFNETPKPTAGERIASLGYYPLDRSSADPVRVAEAARLLAEAERPVVIAGGGVHLSDAADILAALQESAHLPVATTAMGKGATDEGHPLSLGVVGYFMGHRSLGRHLRSLVTEADVVLLVGNRTNQNGTDSWSLYPRGARYIHIDVDGQEVGRNYEALRLVGDARLTLSALQEALALLNLSKRRAARPAVEGAVAAGHAAWKNEIRSVTMDARPIRPERVMQELDRQLTSETVVVADASYSSIWVSAFLRSRHPGMRFVTPRGLAGLGWGLPYALGAKVARPASPVFCLVGDGGFGHVWSELETARRMKLNVVLAVLNNGILGYEKHAEKVLFNDYSDACDFTAVDHAAIARACGWEGIRIEDPAEIADALRRGFAADHPVLLDIITDERAYPPVTMFADQKMLNY